MGEDVGEQLKTITNLLEKLDARISNVEKICKVQEAKSNVEYTEDTAEAGVKDFSDSSTNPAVGAADLQRQYEAVKDSVSRIDLPSFLKVNDSPAGIKQENKSALCILSKSAWYSETGLKLLSFEKTNNCYSLSEEDMNAVYCCFASCCNFLQAEYANMVVRCNFDEETSRIFNNLENNTSVFSDQSLQNIRIAAELAVASNPRRRPNQSNFNSFNYQKRFVRGGRGRPFEPQQPFPRGPAHFPR